MPVSCKSPKASSQKVVNYQQPAPQPAPEPTIEHAIDLTNMSLDWRLFLRLMKSGQRMFSPLCLDMALELTGQAAQIGPWMNNFVGQPTPKRLPSCIELAGGIFGQEPKGPIRVNFPHVIDPRLEAGVINQFVSDQTHGCIKQIVNDSDLQDNDQCLVSCLYFKDDWRQQFRALNTSQQPFRGPKQSRVVDMMSHHADRLSFCCTANWHSVQLPYKSGCYLTLSLPGPGQVITGTSIQDKLQVEEVTPVVPMLEQHYSEYQQHLDRNNYQRQNVGRMWLPKFELEHTLSDLLTPLQAEGLPQELNSDYILDRILQKIYLKVDEEGTTTAAATAVMARCCIMIPQAKTYYNWVGDRPFLLALCEPSGRVLMHGMVDLSAK